MRVAMLVCCFVMGCTLPRAQERTVERDGYATSVLVESASLPTRADGDLVLPELQQQVEQAWLDVTGEDITGCLSNVYVFVPTNDSLQHWCQMDTSWQNIMGCAHVDEWPHALRRENHARLVILREDIYLHSPNISIYAHELIHHAAHCATGDGDGAHEHDEYWRYSTDSVLLRVMSMRGEVE